MYYQIFATYTLVAVALYILPVWLDDYTTLHEDYILEKIGKIGLILWGAFAFVTVIKLIWDL